MNQTRFVIAFAVLSLAGCTCRPDNIDTAKGEVRWEWLDANGMALAESSAVVDFGTISMGARRDTTLKVRNVGRAAFTMNEFAQLMGSPVSINNVPVEGQSFLLTFDPALTLSPADETSVAVAFIPPIVVEPFVDHVADLELKPAGADSSTLTLKGRAVAGACALPETIDFGALPIGKSADQTIEIANNGEVAIRFTSGGVLDAPADSFFFLGLNNGEAEVPAGGNTTITVRFSPQEPRDYNGTVAMRRGESCPQQNVRVIGRGVTSCLSWRPDPADAASGQILSYGAVPPGAVKEGTVTFLNQCTVPVGITRLRTNEATFVVTLPGDGALTVPGAVRDMAGAWVDGEGRSVIDFRPTALGPRQGLLLADTDLASQQALSVALRGYGGGPKIDVRPNPTLNFGRVGFTPGSTPPLTATRNLRITNVGSRPNPPDPEANLHLGQTRGGMPFSLVALEGGMDELCVGEFDAVGNACIGGAGAGYDTAAGIEAGGAGLGLPVRLIPRSAGPKSYELTIYSNDITAPETKIQITANAIEAPPCNYTVSPTNLAFGLIDAPMVQQQSFTLTNLGTQASEVCFFSGFELSPTSHAMFSLVNAPADIEVPAQGTATVTVRAQPMTPATQAASVSGAVTFNVPTTSGGNGGRVDLSATLAPACLTITPSPLDFGNVQTTCGSPERYITVTNSCTQPVTYNGVTLADASVAPDGTGACATNGGCPQFSLTSQGNTGVLQPGQSRAIGMRFRPYSVASFTGTLVINMESNGSPAPFQVELRGAGIPQTSASCVQAVCPPPMTVNANTTVTLTPSVTSSGGQVCAWSAPMRPPTSNGTFGSPTSCTSTTYFADVVGTHVVSLNVNDGAGATAQCQTPITVLPTGDLWIEMTWDKNYDLDLALMHPNAGPYTSAGAWSSDPWTCNYIRDTPSWGSAAQSPSLDRDDTVARGPENIRINSPANSVAYVIGSHMYGSSVPSGGITSTIKVYCAGSLVTTQTRTMSTAKQLWVVGTLQFPGNPGACTFTPVNSTVNNVYF